MELYVALVSGLLAFASAFGLVSYLGNQTLFEAAWHNKKYIRTSIIVLLHGPLVWIYKIFDGFKYMIIFTHMMICWFLQELPKGNDNEMSN